MQKGGGALHDAIRANDKEEFNRLIAEGADINEQDETGATPLIIAFNTYGRAFMATLLSKRGINLNAQTNSGDTLLKLAIKRPDWDTFDKLLKRRDLDVNAGTIGWLPIMFTIRNSFLHNRFFDLMKHRSMNVNQTNDKGETALMIAAYWRNSSAIRMLLAKGANVNAQDNTGKTALMQAVLGGGYQIAVHAWDPGPNKEIAQSQGLGVLLDKCHQKNIFTT